MRMPTQDSRRSFVAWSIACGLVASALLITLLSAVVQATILVDSVPGGDTGLATTTALDSAYRTMNWSFAALLIVITIGVAAPLIISRSRRRRKTTASL